MHFRCIKKLIIIFPAILFLIITVNTLSDYGVIWDEPDHFFRGQAYLNYFLTGNDDYRNLSTERRSYYQDDNYTAKLFFLNDGGHPPLNGILAALTNYFFYQKWGILGDIEAHHLFGVLVSSISVLLIGIFAYKTYGLLASLTAGIVMASYPLFFGEAHFNVKDPVETTFFTAVIFSLWYALKTINWKWLLMSVLSFAFAIGTKFNVLFVPLIIGPYFWLEHSKSFVWKNLPKKFRLVLLLSPIVVAAIFIGTWPYLWFQPKGLFRVISFYIERGVTSNVEAGIFWIVKINLYPLIWIIITTPPWVLILTMVGIIKTIFTRTKQDKVALLWLIWLLVPIIRVSVPYARTYGGVRQIMEYIPAMALLAGLGAQYLSKWLNFKIFKKNTVVKLIIPVAIILIFLPHIFVLVKLHPNENVYFNSLIGGIAGAKEKNIPFWGNSFGNAYLQAIWWLNQNAEINAKLALLQKVNTNISPVMLRKDISYYDGFYRSGIYREGEYIIELTHQGSMHHYPYIWEYINKFLEPVYQVTVDGIPIAKVWKNDLEHTKKNMRLQEEISPAELSVDGEDHLLMINLPKEILLSRLIFDFNYKESCGPVMGEVWIAKEDGQWYKEEELFHAQQLSDSRFKEKKHKEFFFAARPAKFIKIILEKPNQCFHDELRVQVLKFI